MTTAAFDLIGVGSPIIDTLIPIEEAFLEKVGGAKGGMELIDAARALEILALVSDPVTDAPGGSAGNTTIGVARLGLKTTFLGKLGNDPMGGVYRTAFGEAGGDGSRFKTGRVPNARCLSLVTPDSQRTMRTDLGAAMGLAPDEITADDFKGCRHAHIEGYLLFNRALLMKVLESAKAAGCTISLDLASFEVVRAAADILPSILKDYVTIVFANEDEAGAFTGMGSDYEGMARHLAGLCRIAVVKMGKEGSLIASGGNVLRVKPVWVEKAVDTTGAGDLWAAGFLYGWLKGHELDACGRYGSVLGAEVVQVMGASIPPARWSEIHRQLGS
jgi:sugar/nucleoside kinase (ribokinase family)